MVLDDDCKCGPGFYSTCQSEYRQEPAGACKNKNSEHKTSGQSNCAVCPEGTGTAADVLGVYRAFCTTCYAGTYSYDGECKKCEDGYACIPPEGLVEPNNYFTCEKFFMGAHANSNAPYYTVWSSNPGGDCNASRVTGPNEGVNCENVGSEMINVGTEEDPEYVESDGSGGWVSSHQGNGLSENVKRPRWYCAYESNRFGPGVINNELQHIKCPTGTFATRDQTKYGPFTISGIERGATECRECDDGYVSTKKGSLQCSPCKPGTYQKGDDKTKCVACPKRTYQDEEGQANCKVCPDPWMTTEDPKPVSDPATMLGAGSVGATSVDDCNVQITTMRFTTRVTDGCSWEWPTNDSSPLVTGGSFMQVMPNDKVKVNLKDTCVEETDGDCKVQD